MFEVNVKKRDGEEQEQDQLGFGVLIINLKKSRKIH